MSSCIWSTTATRFMIVVLLDCVPQVSVLRMHIHIIYLNIYTCSLPCIGTRQSKQSCFWLTGFIPGTFLKSPRPKSSQARYLPESHAIHDHYVAVARFWSSIVGFAVWEIDCLRTDFSASDIVYVTDGLVSSVFATMQHKVCHACGS